MAEKRELKDFLASLFRDFILKEAKDYIENFEAFRFDSEKGDYRTKEEVERIEGAIRARAEEMAADFLEELEAKGVVTSRDYKEKWTILEETLRDYREKILEWLRRQ